MSGSVASAAVPEELELRRLKNQLYAKTRNKAKQRARQNEYYKREYSNHPEVFRAYQRAYRQRPSVRKRASVRRWQDYFNLVSRALSGV